MDTGGNFTVGKTAVGFYLSVHPLDNFKKTLSDLKVSTIEDHSNSMAGETVRMAGIVSGSQVKYSKKGNRFCVFRLEDQTGGVKCLAWSESFTKYSELMKDDELLIVEGRIESGEGQDITLILSEAKVLADAVPQKARGVSITLPKQDYSEEYFEDLLKLLSSNQGKCDVFLNFTVDELMFKIHSQPLRIQGTSKLERDLTNRGCRIEWVL